MDVDTAAAAAIKGSELLVSVIARGRTLGGTELESGAWQYQIGVCAGCTCGGGSTPACMEPPEDAQGDCRAGIDGHCRYVDSDCP